MHETEKTLLEAQLEAVTAELTTLAVLHKETGDWEIRFDNDPRSEADEDIISDNAEAAEEAIATLALLETRYRNINRALTKIADGTYGACEICGEPIEADRLSANPAARTCKSHLNDEVDLAL
ncbi:MAG: TraR/DksA C4-type zinc finger protein [Candidatus Paceibacteria bacterium]